MTDPAATSIHITREGLLDGTLHRMIARAMPETRLLTPEEREASLRTMLEARPTQHGGAWLFCYGSLIWNPTIAFDAQRVATVRGWHRSFCLATKAGRGSAELPGLVLALDEGGSCAGVALHVAEQGLQQELTVVWAREMIAASYRPRWLALHDADGAVFGHGIAFTMNPQSPTYAGDLSAEEAAHRLAFAHGELGSSAEYLFRTRDGLRAHGIHDDTVESFAERVEKLRAATP
ncbi:MAG: gamma-glutamylcyclotransferase [Acidisphaera sp.]|nr:gamma-glutamylcyclotransferase [Acidisphaera sp.]MBV9811839.1 gamma-glutamylcyclotransferase [Acetobacteraceae bacterium]